MNGTRSRVRRRNEYRDWAELVPDALGLIFNRLTMKEKLQLIPRVCKPWRRAVEGPYSWTKIDIDGWLTRYKLDRMLRMLVARSDGCFRELYVSGIDDAQLRFISDNARSLQVLSVQLSSITDSMVEQIAPNLSSLTAINLSHCSAITARSLASIGTNCRSLESLTWNANRTWCNDDYDPAPLPTHGDEGRAIARTMPKLKHLSISYVNIDTKVALEILSGCPELESLNIKGCWRVNFMGGMLEDKYPKVKVVDVHHQDPGDDDYDGWGIYCGCDCCSSGSSSPEPDYIIDY